MKSKNPYRRFVVHYQKSSYDVLIKRPTIWGNPYSHLENTSAKFKVKTREEAIRRYEEWIQTQPELLKKIPFLKGKILGCCCSPDSCHGEILAKLANYEPEEDIIYKIDLL